MKKSKYSKTLSICCEKTDTKSNVSVSLKTSSETESDLQTQSKPIISLIGKKIFLFILNNFEKILMFYPLIKPYICIDLCIIINCVDFLINILLD